MDAARDDDAGAGPAPAKRSRRPRGPALSRDRIVAEALALVDARGLDAFSFRTLAARLGVQAMSLYNYFPSKAHLFEAMVDACLAEFMARPDTGTWQDRMRAEALALRDLALRHPGFLLYLAIFRMNSRAGLAFLERLMGVVAATGLPEEAQARYFRAVSYYVSGACIDETLGYANGPSSVAPVPEAEARRDFPRIMAAGRWWAEGQRRATFELGLDAFIAAIEADLAALRR